MKRQFSVLVIATLLYCFGTNALAQLANDEIEPMADRIGAVVEEESERLKAIFMDIHENPELGFMETRTAAIVAKELETLGFDVQTGIGGTGVVGVMRNGPGPY